ncbi:MAG: hypothetical protein EXR67_06015, partial [Dehalococcoidia bacterium]|nr:hypothetical protein [Dehalococcoidia bacterium]
MNEKMRPGLLPIVGGVQPGMQPGAPTAVQSSTDTGSNGETPPEMLEPHGPKPRFPLRNLSTFGSFQVPAFRYYFAAMVGQGTAMNMQMMAQALLVYRITGSATALGIMSLASAVPMLVFSLMGGVLADRLKK